MDFELTDDQVALRDGIRAFLTGRTPLDSLHPLEVSGGGIDRALWSEFGGMGVFSLRNDGFGTADAVLAFAELGRALTPGPLVATHLAAALPGDLGAGAAAGTRIDSRPEIPPVPLKRRHRPRQERHAVPCRLLAAALSQVERLDAVREAEVVAVDLRPQRATGTVVHDGYRPAQTRQVDRRRQARGPAPDDEAIDRPAVLVIHAGSMARIGK